jgi:NAD+ kinase
MKKVGIIPNIEKEKSKGAAERIIEFLNKKGFETLIEKETAVYLGINKEGCDEEELFSQSDFIVVLGGDGTMLNAGKKACEYNTPLIGINLGHLGFLTDTDTPGIENSLSKVINGEYKLEKRMMIEAEVHSLSEGIHSFYCLNEFAVSRGNMVEVGVYVNDEYIDDFFGDGVLVSTPTGSTAYNLSAGGPILKTDSNMLAITPICPHTLYARSIVVGADDIVKLVIDRYSKTDLSAVVDGLHVSAVNKDDTIIIKKSDKYVTIMKTNKMGFYDVLREKMFNKGGR